MITSSPKYFKHPWLQWSHVGQDWTSVEDWQFIWGDGQVLKRIIIPKGQDTDKASVPFLKDIFRTDGPWEGPAFMHDMAYKCKGKWLIDPTTNTSWYQTSTDNGGTWQNGSPWARRDADNMLAFTGECASAPNAGLYKWACKLYPVNWFKGF